MAKVDVTGFNSIAHSLGRWGVRARVEEAVRRVAESAVENIQETIDTSHTGKNWVADKSGRTLSQRFDPNSTRYGSHDGRVHSGAMRRSVDSTPESVSDTEIVYKVGWVEGTPLYAEYQEYGFRHWITNEQILGMNSLATSRDIAANTLLSELNKAAIDILRGL